MNLQQIISLIPDEIHIMYYMNLSPACLHISVVYFPRISKHKILSSAKYFTHSCPLLISLMFNLVKTSQHTIILLSYPE